MKGNAKVIEALNGLLKEELTAINQYFVHAEMAENWGYGKLLKLVRARSITEMKHAEELIERIIFLEGIPHVGELNKVNVGADVPKQLANEWEWEVIFIMGRADFQDGLALQLQDVGSQFKFSDYPVAFNNFCGNAELPFPIGLEPYRFAKQSNLSLLAVDVGTLVQPAVVIGVGTGGIATFTGQLFRNGQSVGGPVLPGSVTVTDPAGVIVGTDSANNGVIATVPPGVGIIGTINYQTGAISVTYAVNPAAGTLITVAWTSGVAVNNVEIDMWGHALLTAFGGGAISPALGS